MRYELLKYLHAVGKVSHNNEWQMLTRVVLISHLAANYWHIGKPMKL